MIEDDALGDEWQLERPVDAIRRVSHDPTLRTTITRADGTRATALEVQWGLLERARKYELSHGLAAVGEAVGADVLNRWERVLVDLEHDPDRSPTSSTGSPSSGSSTGTATGTTSSRATPG